MNTPNPAAVAALAKAPRPRPDFITIQLSPAGIAFAGTGATLSIRRQRMDYTFKGSAGVEVLKSEWTSLAKLRDTAGNAILVPVAAQAPAVPPAPTTTAVKA